MGLLDGARIRQLHPRLRSCAADWRAGNGCGTTNQHSSNIGERALLLRVVKRVRPDARTDLGRQRSAERAHAIAQFGGSDCSDAQQASCTPVCAWHIRARAPAINMSWKFATAAQSANK